MMYLYHKFDVVPMSFCFLFLIKSSCYNIHAWHKCLFGSWTVINLFR